MGMQDALLAAAAELRDSMRHYKRPDGGSWEGSREMAIYVLLRGLAETYVFSMLEDDRLMALLNGDESLFDDPQIAAMYTRREGVPIPDKPRAALTQWYSAVGHAIHILDDYILPVLNDSSLRYLTPEGEVTIDKVLVEFQQSIADQ